MMLTDQTKDSFLSQFEGINSPIADKKHLSSIFANAWAALATQPLPNNKHEEWRYTNFSAVWQTEFVQSNHVDIEAARLALPAWSKRPDTSLLVCVNGQFVPELSCLGAEVRACLDIKPISQAIEHSESGIFAQFSDVNTITLAMNTAFMQDGLWIRVRKTLPENTVLGFVNMVDARNQNVAVQPRHFWHFEANTQASLIEQTITLGQGHSFLNQVSEIKIERGAMIQHAVIQDDTALASQVLYTHVHLDKQAQYHNTVVSFGGLCVRNDLYIRLSEHCEAFMNGLYMISGKTLVDNHTVADHAEPNAQSNELYKGVLDGHSTGIFNGKIFVRQDAQKTNAYQKNRNILLSPTAHVFTKPQLEIWADDVKCSHGATTGALEAEPMFYLKARGIPEHKARLLLLNAFMFDVLDRIVSSSLKSLLSDFLEEKLETNL
ncbi:MAG: Fe-S cluster assembly protein SufD [Cytophagales bacterium]|nr:MAG: Fe-S cluster assembly protein SufD [Cytophagales bacterium]TAF59776.1 MAG: Fe-S cluster assembly protein SufD [Cytophagales bacterium]